MKFQVIFILFISSTICFGKIYEQNQPHRKPHILLSDTPVQVGGKKIKKENLQTAITDGDIDEVKKLIEEGADVNAKDEIGRTPLHFVTNKVVAELLIAKGADVNARTKDGSTLLYTMAWNGNKEMVELLLENGADVNAKHKKNHTPLHFAVRTGKKEVVKLLLTNGALVNAKDEWGYTPLYWANKKDYRDIAELLLANGANKNLLYQKQDSIENALEFIGTPEDMMNIGFVKKRGQLAGSEQLVFVNKLFKANFDKDVDLFLSMLSKGTKKEVKNNWNMAYLLSTNIRDGIFLPTEDEDVIKFFAVYREFTDKDRDRLKDYVSWPDMPSYVISVFHFNRRAYMLAGSPLYVAKDGPDYKLICPTNLKVPFKSHTVRSEDNGPKEYGIVKFEQNDDAYGQQFVWKYEWDVEIERNVVDGNTFQLLKTTNVILGNADLHPEIAVQKIIDESVLEKYKYNGLRYTFRIGNTEPSFPAYNYGQQLTNWSYSYSIASSGMSGSIYFPGKDITNVKANKQGSFIGSDLEFFSFETSDGNIKYEHKVILRKDGSPEAKVAVLIKLEQMKQRQISDKKLYYLKEMLTAYADDHNSTYPDRLEQIKPYDDDGQLEWLLRNVEYLGKSAILTETLQKVLAYDKTLLEKTGNTTVLFNDGPVQYYKSDRFKKLGITGDQKNTGFFKNRKYPSLSFLVNRFLILRAS